MLLHEARNFLPRTETTNWGSDGMRRCMEMPTPTRTNSNDQTRRKPTGDAQASVPPVHVHSSRPETTPDVG